MTAATPKRPATTPPSRLPLILVIVVPLVALWPVVRAEFIPLDDPANVSRNPDFNPPTLRGVARYWTKPFLNMYAPLTYTAWAALARLAWMDSTDAAGNQLNPYVFHAANLLVHVVNAVLVFALLRKLIAPPPWAPWAPCLGALLFALHPMQVEPVAWVTGFRDLLAATFSLGSLMAYLSHATRQGREATRAYVLSCAFLLAAMLCKPTAVIVPLLAAALDWGVLGRPLRKLAKPVAGLVLLAIPFAVIATRAQTAALTFTSPLWARPIIALDAVGFYLLKLALPLRLGLDYGRSPQWLLDQRGLAWAWAVVVMLALVLWMLRPDRHVIAGILIFLAALLPVLGLTKFDFQHHSTVADRYVYLAMLGPALLLMSAARRWGPAATVACCALLLLFAARGHAQARAWKNGESIYRATLAANPDSLIANRGLGLLAQQSSRLANAEAFFKTALRAHPNDPVGNFHLGNLYLMTRRPAQAVPHLRIAAAARDQPWVTTNYANALAQSGHVTEARAALEEALTVTPDSAELHASLAAVLLAQGDRPAAAEHYRTALRINPDFALAARELAALERSPASAPSSAPASAPSTSPVQ